MARFAYVRKFCIYAKFAYVCKPGHVYTALVFFLLEKVKTLDISENIAACDLPVVRCRQLIELMKVCVSIEGNLHTKIKTDLSQKPLGHFKQILYVSF